LSTPVPAYLRPVPSPRAPASGVVGGVHPLPRAPLADADLAALAARGDPRAAAEIWDKHSSLVRGILCRSLGPSDEIADLVQEVFLRFFRELKNLRDPNALRSFLIGITLRVAGSELRRRRVRRWLRLTDTGTLPEPASERSSDPQHALTRLYAILDGLDTRGRLAFTLRHFEGYELTELAAALGCSLATAKRHLARAQDRVYAITRREALFAPYLAAGLPTEEDADA
jgi:RNA polymerase sigma-70 factor (ECF subfamily)